MATVIKEVRSQRRSYPWNLWGNGKAWRAVKGEDFNVTPASFAAALYSHASRNSRKVHVSIVGDSVEFQFSKFKQ